MYKVNVKLKEESYPLIIGENSFVNIIDYIDHYKLNKKLLVIIDKNVNKYHRDKIQKVFKSNKNKISFYQLKPGENSKSYIELNKIYSFMLKNNFGRDSLIIAIGGGVTGDLAGYAAATFMRGIQIVHVPTTLLAAVDSSVGGKTGINFENKKNMIGAFYQPKFVLIDTQFLYSLSKAEITSGLGEIIKYAYLSDVNFFNFIKKNLNKIENLEIKTLTKAIINSDKIKAAVVSQDEKESGLRKILNLGHTFAHAFETELNFTIKHGEAVAAGIICALILSNKLGLLSNKNLNNYLALSLRINLPKKFIHLNSKNLFKIMQHDKKNRNGKIKFVLLSDIGSLLIDIEASKPDVFFALKEMKKIIS